MGGRITVESVARCSWNGWPDDRGIRRLAERTLKRRFQQATRLSPNLYVQKVRIDKAKKLLLASSMSVKAIAYEVGYENVSFFVRLFKTHVGQTPAAWRKCEAISTP
ncbi:helix-turn-helix domain-containing protein [Pseudomonas aeruginosa]